MSSGVSRAIGCPCASSTPAVAAGDDQAARVERGREVRGERVGIDVQQRAVCVDADAGDHRHVAAVEQVAQQRDVAALRLADEAEVDLLAR